MTPLTDVRLTRQRIKMDIYITICIISSIVIMLRMQISEVHCELKIIKAPIELNRTKVKILALKSLYIIIIFINAVIFKKIDQQISFTYV